MTTPPTGEPKAIEGMRRLLRHLPQGDDLTLIVLKGHLLIEEQLTDMLEKRMTSKASALKKARLQFSQLLAVVRGLTYVRERAWMWTGISKLNSLRNDLVHHIEPKRVEALVKQIIQALKVVVDLAPLGLRDNTAGRLRAAIALMYASLVTYDWK